MRRGFLILFLLVFSSALVASGCGSGDDSNATGSEASSSDKVAFIKQADAVCEEADETQKDGLTSYMKQNPGADQSKAVIAVGLPPVQVEAEELAELEAPSGDEDEVAAIVEGIEAAVKAAEKDPESVLGTGKDPFTAVDKLASEYGFKVCNSAA